jgi:Mrp family chromosome partitioning ATPase
LVSESKKSLINFNQEDSPIMTKASQKEHQSENQNIAINKIGKTIAIAGGKGGSGKTFITSLLAVC